ncbi:MAG: hypothetical protein NWF01_07825 [Candidatus Bathyarchaeota archaeon]|nr:hypothetical protein [Candidatus Bathyarchaeota archaeon]
MDFATMGIIVSSLIAIFAALGGASFKMGKDKVTALLDDVLDAVQDDKITEAECQKIAADVRAIRNGEKTGSS